MKKTIIFFVILMMCHHSHAQWVPSLLFDRSEQCASISAPTDKSIWAITNSFVIYNSTNGGTTWNKFQAKGLGNMFNLSVNNLYAINSSVALLSVDSTLTGVGPGFIYRTTDGGRNWTKVFSHAGNCDIKMGMFNNNTGLMSCSFNSFDGSIKSGQQLFFTTDGGKSWKLDPVNPSTDFSIASFVTNGLQVAMSDFNHIYFSSNAGRTWTHTAQKISLSNLQVKDSSYAMGSSGSLSLSVKRPGKPWKQSEADSLLSRGFISALVLDNNECWVAEGLDTPDNYYSADSGKTFTTFRTDSLQGFVMMTKARNGKTVIGITNPFGGPSPSTVWINTRQQNLISTSKNLQQTNNLASASLTQNRPNPFSNSTTINYQLPQQYSSAKIIITDRNGYVFKQVMLSNKGKGSVQVDASTFAPGIYEYALIIDGKVTGTKQMMIIK